ncbi:GMC oxidoreductase [Hypoxylon trugodes]|uniref:GMC oxidoreductase n=1 Tax=Hypoxylon trugodes TaxID=326681 RepID=UPI00218D7585|nr:GMC oxidoreductase [Hypoxylon trugodes]KAI1391075.1 GMC oxidoreductase [Hypoxylon trugodes]
MSSTYDFVIVGGGPSGAAIAISLARSAKRPKVLLLEAGGTNDDKEMRVNGRRWLVSQSQGLNWGYKTAPQEYCGGRELDYSRGLGLGGSSAINFSIFNVGASGDYDEWVRVVGDDAFGWAHMKRRYRTLESFDPTPPAGVPEKYAKSKPEDHGNSGLLKTGYTAEVEADLVPLLEAYEKAGRPLNPDHNSGNPLGVALTINSASKGFRSTAADLLVEIPENLTILTKSLVQRIILEGEKAVGVESNGKKHLATKEVIISAGALNTPKLLMHSGIGPRAQLEKFNIPVVQDIPCIGQGLRDHFFVPIAHIRKTGDPDRVAFYSNEQAKAVALEQWKKDGTGPWAKYGCQATLGWFKLPNLSSLPEFEDLPTEEKNHLNRPTIPHYAIGSHFPLHWFIPNFPPEAMNYMTLAVFLYNAQSRGEVTLQSSDPDAPPRIDPKFLSTPFDRRAVIEALRDALRFVNSEAYVKDNVAPIAVPAGDSDEDYLEYWRASVGSSWHMTGTVKMGKPGDDDAAVDSNFRLMGFDGLRIADMSIVPVIASCHVQSVAYLTGLTCAEKLIAEYDLA